MQFKKLLEGSNYYNQKYPHWVESYFQLRQRGDEYWIHLEKLSKDLLETQVVGEFLNDWACRVAYKKSTASLKEAVEVLPPYYQAVRDETLEDLRFDDQKDINGQRLSIAEITKEIMQNLLGVRPKFGPVPASKLMHMAIPELFVMWDTGIKSKYHIPNSYGSNQAMWYVRFLKLMKLEMNHAISDLMRIKGINRQKAKDQIKAINGNLTLTRIVDKYNFAIRNGIMDPCDECAQHQHEILE